MSRPVTLVTGASRGIGLAIAERLVRDGHHVIGVSRSAPPAGVPIEFQQADLADAASTAAALAEITRRHEIDNLVANAGAQVVDRAGAIALDAFEKIVAINARALIQCIEACLPAMRARKAGRIVSIGSRAALGRADRASYAFTKGGLISLTRSIALEVARDGITANIVAPGPVVTELFLEGKSEVDVARLAAAAPLKRLGTPGDVAGAVAFLVGPDAGYITGQVLYVCGGLSIGPAPV